MRDSNGPQHGQLEMSISNRPAQQLHVEFTRVPVRTPLTQYRVQFCPLQVVDLTGETRRLASGLSEAHLRCDERQRDEFLYYILVRTRRCSASTPDRFSRGFSRPVSLAACYQIRASRH